VGPVSYIIVAVVLRERTFMSAVGVASGANQGDNGDGADKGDAVARRGCWPSGGWALSGLGGSLRKPRQPVDTTLGWLRRGVDTGERPDCGLAGRGHIEAAGAVVVVVKEVEVV
jgi:hypothetical protein